MEDEVSRFAFMTFFIKLTHQRYSLNYKGLPYNTVWIEYPDVESTLRTAGVPSTAIKSDGMPMYTLPAIVDPNTGVAIAESFLIAQYLDKTYTDKPILIPKGTKMLQGAFIAAVMKNIYPLFQFTALKICENLLNPRSEAYFREARKNDLFCGMSIDEAYPKGERFAKEWEKVKTCMGKIAKWMDEESMFVMGNIVSFADFVLGGLLMTAKTAWGRDSKEWSDLSSWDGRRWERLLSDLEEYSEDT